MNLYLHKTKQFYLTLPKCSIDTKLKAHILRMEHTSIHNSGSLYLLMVVALSVTRSQYRHYSALQGVMGSQLGNGHSGHWQSEHLGCPTDHMILTTGDLSILTFIARKRARRCFYSQYTTFRM